MKYEIAFLFSFLFVSCSLAQSEVSWDFSYDAAEGKILAHAEIGQGWHLYSTQEAAELGPVATAFQFSANEGVELKGSIHEPDPVVAYDANFEETLYYFEDAVVFSQDVVVKGATKIDGVVTFMVCNDEMCMPPVDVEFTIELTDEN